MHRTEPRGSLGRRVCFHGKRLRPPKWLIGPFKWYGHSLIFGNKWQGANQNLLLRRKRSAGMPMSTPWCSERQGHSLSGLRALGSSENLPEPQQQKPPEPTGMGLTGLRLFIAQECPALGMVQSLLCRLQHATGPRHPARARRRELWSQETRSTELLALSFSG